MEARYCKVIEIFKITGNWESQSKQLRYQFPLLTEADIKFEPGRESELLYKIENRLYKTRAEVIDILKKWELRSKCTT